MSRGVFAVIAALSAATSGCGVLGSASDSGTPVPVQGGGQAKGGGVLVKEGWFGFGSHARLEIQRVERHADKAVLRFFVTNLEQDARTPSFGVAGVAGVNNLHFMLVDTAGRKAYRPLYDSSQTTVGSKASSSEPGVRYEAVLYFPPIPAGVKTLTVISPGTAGSSPACR